MVSSDEIKRRLADKRKGSSKAKNTEKSSYKSKNTGRGYLVCNKCGGYYELQKGESPKDFGECKCGGSLTHVKNLGENEEVTKDSTSSNKFTSGSILNLWSKQETKTKIIGISALIVILAIAGLYLSSISTPTFEDKLIQSSESGVSQTDLLSTIENHYNVVKDNLNARQHVDIALVNSKSSSGQISDTEKGKELNNISMKYQTEFANWDSIKALQIAYVNNLSSAEDLKTSTNVLYQQSPDLSQLRRAQ